MAERMHAPGVDVAETSVSTTDLSFFSSDGVRRFSAGITVLGLCCRQIWTKESV